MMSNTYAIEMSKAALEKKSEESAASLFATSQSVFGTVSLRE